MKSPAAMIFIPSFVTPKPDVKKYYGVRGLGCNGGDLRDRAFIKGNSPYPTPKNFRVININHVTQNNTWDCIEKMSALCPNMGLEKYIIKLYELGFEVVEFNTPHELMMWLAEAHE